MIVRELFARLGMKTDKGSFKKADQSLDKIKKAAAAIAGILASATIVRGFGRIIVQTTATADAIAKTARKLGVGAEAFQEYQYAAESSGVRLTAFNMGLQRFTRRTAEAVKGTGIAKDALEQMGIQLKDNQGNLRPADDLLLDVADSLSKVTSEGEKVRLAFKLFDSEGVSMINMLGGGRDALEALRKEARETEGIFSGEFLDASEKFTQKMGKLSLVFRGIKTRISEQLLPPFTKLIDLLTKGLVRLSGFMKGTKLLTVIMYGLAAAAAVLTFVLGFKLAAAVGGLAKRVIVLAGAFNKAGAAALLMQIKAALIGVAFILLAAIILLAAEEIYGAFTGMDTLGKRLSDTLGELYEDFLKLGEDNRLVQALVFPFQMLLRILARTKDALFAIIIAMTGGGLSGFKTLWEDVQKDAKATWEASGRIMGVDSTVQPSPQAAAGAGAVSSSQQVTVNQTINAGAGQSTEAVGKAAGDQIRIVLREENRKALNTMMPGRAGII